MIGFDAIRRARFSPGPRAVIKLNDQAGRQYEPVKVGSMHFVRSVRGSGWDQAWRAKNEAGLELRTMIVLIR
jgi:hypothetical protein